MTELQTMVAYMGGSLDDILDGSDFKLPRPEIVALKKDIEVLSEENAILQAEIAVLKDKIVALDAENDRLRLTLEHKDDLLSLHKYYMTLLKAGD
jgi:regulator of replication initiation timing